MGTKHRKDWTAWLAAERAKYKEQQAFQEIMARMIQDQADRLFASGVMDASMRPTPMPVFSGTKIQSPIIYEKKP